ncbi:MAG: flagellar hook assembly protein FlgD [Treponema sp.]|nr:flagellar hook assembly protein FlgD [Treponema sp.]
MEMNTVNSTLTSSEKFAIENEVNNFNKTLNVSGRTPSQQLGKDDFLKLLITQLTNQDPTSPMEDTQFISQMAQFSSLEQMTNMNESFNKMASMINAGQAASTLGKTVELDVGDTTTQGVVEATSFGANPQVMVNGMYYDLNKIKAVYN